MADRLVSVCVWVGVFVCVYVGVCVNLKHRPTVISILFRS